MIYYEIKVQTARPQIERGPRQMPAALLILNGSLQLTVGNLAEDYRINEG